MSDFVITGVRFNPRQVVFLYIHDLHRPLKIILTGLVIATELVLLHLLWHNHWALRLGTLAVGLWIIAPVWATHVVVGTTSGKKYELRFSAADFERLARNVRAARGDSEQLRVADVSTAFFRSQYVIDFHNVAETAHAVRRTAWFLIVPFLPFLGGLMVHVLSRSHGGFSALLLFTGVCGSVLMLVGIPICMKWYHRGYRRLTLSEVFQQLVETQGMTVRGVGGTEAWLPGPAVMGA